MSDGAGERLLARRGRGQVIVLGCPKSGTSAVASLLADHAGLSKTIDIRSLWQPHINQILRGRLTLRDVVLRDPGPFEAGLVKEPNLTLLPEQLRDCFPEAQLVYLVRHPMDNLRSILDRTKVRGDHWFLNKRRLPPAWREGFDRELAGSPSGHYVSILAHWWNRMADTYLVHGAGMHLLRYEDFRKDKVAGIAALADRLGLPHKGDVRAKADVQYQPKGQKVDVDVREFFGRNLRRIERICGDRLAPFGYSADADERVHALPVPAKA